jgi:hypothetical protein
LVREPIKWSILEDRSSGVKVSDGVVEIDGTRQDVNMRQITTTLRRTKAVNMMRNIVDSLPDIAVINLSRSTPAYLVCLRKKHVSKYAILPQR